MNSVCEKLGVTILKDVHTSNSLLDKYLINIYYQIILGEAQ